MSLSLFDILNPPQQISPMGARMVHGKATTDVDDFTDEDLAGVGATRESGEWTPRPCPRCAKPMHKWGRTCIDCYRAAHNMAERKPHLSPKELRQQYLARKERRRQIDARRAKAAQAVSKAVRQGALRPARELTCVDCGVQAFCYDHRDYSKPLDVDPVCKRCDCLRGAAAPYDGFDGRWLRRMQATAKRLAERATEGQVTRHVLRPDIFGPAPASRAA